MGPQDGNEKVLQSCYERSLEVLVENGLHTIAFPCIATGVYGFDNEKAANIALATVRSYLEKKDSVSRPKKQKEKKKARESNAWLRSVGNQGCFFAFQSTRYQDLQR